MENFGYLIGVIGFLCVAIVVVFSVIRSVKVLAKTYKEQSDYRVILWNILVILIGVIGLGCYLIFGILAYLRM